MKQVKSKIINKTSIWYNNLIASDLHHSFEKWVGKLIDDTPTIMIKQSMKMNPRPTEHYMEKQNF